MPANAENKQSPCGAEHPGSFLPFHRLEQDAVDRKLVFKRVSSDEKSDITITISGGFYDRYTAEDNQVQSIVMVMTRDEDLIS